MKHLLARTGLLFSLAACSLGAQAGLVAYYDFNGPAGTANDVTGNGHNATSVVGVTQVAGRTGNPGDSAYQFNGDVNNDMTSYIDVNLNLNLYPLLTMGAWVQVTESTPRGKVISHDNGGYDRTLGLDNRAPEGSGWSAFTGTDYVAGGGVVSPKKWQFIAVTYEQDDTTSLFVDGLLVSGGPALHGTGLNFTRIGGNPSFGEWFDGLIDDVFFFDEILSNDEILEMSSSGVPFNPPGPDGQVPAPMTLLLLALGLFGISLTRKS